MLGRGRSCTARSGTLALDSTHLPDHLLLPFDGWICGAQKLSLGLRAPFVSPLFSYTFRNWRGVQRVTALSFRDGTKWNSPLWAEILEAEFKRPHSLDSGEFDFFLFEVLPLEKWEF